MEPTALLTTQHALVVQFFTHFACICPCENNHPNCNKLNEILSVYPGGTVQASVVAIGQRDGIVPTVVRCHIDKGRLQSSQYIQQTTKTCTTLNYTVFSQQNVTIELYPDGQCSIVSDELFYWLNVSQSCPLGFNMNPVDNLCVCGQTLQYQQLQYNKWIRANNT